MRFLLLTGSLLLILGTANLPIGYYTLLRIATFIVALMVIIKEYKNGSNFWTISFGIIAILFNPIIPIYLLDKTYWIPIDILASIIFGIKALAINK